MKSFVGIDVGKYQLEVYLENKNYSFDNTILGLKKLIRSLNQIQSSEILIIFEATGGYERLLKQKLDKHNFSYHLAHPNKVRAYAKATGLLAKTDKIDAKLLADYAEVMKSEAYQAKNNEEIKDLLKRREQLLEEKNREGNRSDKELGDFIKKSIKKHIDWIDKEISNIEKQIKQLNEKTNNKEEIKLLTSIPGIGVLTALYILSYLPEITTANKAEIAALTGVAPINRDSGSYRGKRFIQGGRAPLRRALYMSAIPSIRFNPQMRSFYQRLKDNGKNSKLALVAVMRKLMILASSILKRGTPWVESLSPCS